MRIAKKIFRATWLPFLVGLPMGLMEIGYEAAAGYVFCVYFLAVLGFLGYICPWFNNKW